jgi:hypothetical protein
MGRVVYNKFMEDYGIFRYMLTRAYAALIIGIILSAILFAVGFTSDPFFLRIGVLVLVVSVTYFVIVRFYNTKFVKYLLLSLTIIAWLAFLNQLILQRVFNGYSVFLVGLISIVTFIRFKK